MEFNSLFSGLLEAVDDHIAVAEPVRVEGEIVDLRLIWVSDSLDDFVQLRSAVGQLFSDIYPEIYDHSWLEQIIVTRSTGARTTLFRKVPLPRPSGFDTFELSTRWAGDFLVLTVHDLSTGTASNADIVRSTAIFADMLAESPWLMRMNLPNQTLEFSTASFQAIVGTESPSLEMIVCDSDRDDLSRWLSTPVEERGVMHTFRVHAANGQTRWVEIRAESISGTDIEIDIIRDVDGYVSSQRASQGLADALHGQLEVVTKALDASSDGFAIWRAVRGGSGQVTTFRLDFMNTAGAAPTGFAATDILNQAIEHIVGDNAAQGLIDLFQRCLDAGQPIIDVVEVASEHGWVGTFENHVTAIGPDRVVASFRNISGS